MLYIRWFSRVIVTGIQRSFVCFTDKKIANLRRGHPAPIGVSDTGWLEGMAARRARRNTAGNATPSDPKSSSDGTGASKTTRIFGVSAGVAAGAGIIVALPFVLSLIVGFGIADVMNGSIIARVQSINVFDRINAPLFSAMQTAAAIGLAAYSLRAYGVVGRVGCLADAAAAAAASGSSGKSKSSDRSGHSEKSGSTAKPGSSGKPKPSNKPGSSNKSGPSKSGSASTQKPRTTSKPSGKPGRSEHAANAARVAAAQANKFADDDDDFTPDYMN